MEIVVTWRVKSPFSDTKPILPKNSCLRHKIATILRVNRGIISHLTPVFTHLDKSATVARNILGILSRIIQLYQGFKSNSKLKNRVDVFLEDIQIENSIN